MKRVPSGVAAPAPAPARSSHHAPAASRARKSRAVSRNRALELGQGVLKRVGESATTATTSGGHAPSSGRKCHSPSRRGWVLGPCARIRMVRGSWVPYSRALHSHVDQSCSSNTSVAFPGAAHGALGRAVRLRPADTPVTAPAPAVQSATSRLSDPMPFSDSVVLALAAGSHDATISYPDAAELATHVGEAITAIRVRAQEIEFSRRNVRARDDAVEPIRCAL